MAWWITTNVNNPSDWGSWCIEDRIEDRIRDLGQEGFGQAHAPYYENLETDSKKPLYLGCTTFTQLSRVLALVNLKARFGWSDKSFTELFLLLKNLLPEDNTLPKNHYKAKKILGLVGMEYQKIMIVFCIEIGLSKCATALYVGSHTTKWSMANAVMMQPQTMIIHQRCVGIFQ